MLVISGQVKRETCKTSYGDAQAALRQLGDQEVDIVRMSKGITKFSEIVLGPEYDPLPPRARLVSGDSRPSRTAPARHTLWTSKRP